MTQILKYKATLLAAIFYTLFIVGCSSPEDSAKKYLDKANHYLQVNEFKKAIIEYKNVLQIQPNSIDAIYGIAQAFERTQDWDRVHQFCARVIELNPKHVGANLKLATIYMAADMMDKALERLDVLEQLDPNNSDFLAVKSSFLYKAGDNKAAVELAKKSLATNPKNSQAIIILSLESLSRNSFDEAISTLKNGINNDPENLQLQLLLVEALEKKNDLPAAEKELVNLTAKYPEDIELLKALAAIYNKQGKVDQVEKVLRTLIKKSPDTNTAVYDLINFVQQTKGEQAALNVINNFINDDPEKTDFQFFKSFYLAKLDKAEESKAVLKHIVENAKDVESINKAKSLLASFAYDKGDVENADNLVAQVLAKDPRNQAALMLKGNREFQLKKYKDAIANLRLIIKDAPTYAPALAMLAQAHEQSGELALAEKYYKLAYDNTGKDPKYALLFVDYLVKYKQYDLAQKMVNSLAVSIPNNPEVLKHSAAVKLALGDLKGAEAIAKEIKDVDKSAANTLLGTIYMNQRNFDEGVSAFNQNYLDKPNDYQALSALVKSLVNADRKLEAQKMLQQIVNNNPENLKPKLLLAKLLIHLHDNNAAINIYKDIIKSHPEDLAAYQQLGELLSDTGRYVEAENVLNEGNKAVKPATTVLSYLLATTYERKGEYDKAIALYAELIQKEPESIVAKNNYISLVTDYKSDSALLNKAYDLSKDLVSTSPYIQDTIGWIAYKVGKYDEARKALQNAVQGAPKVALFAYHLGMAQAALSDHASAKESLQRALKLKANNQEIPVELINKKIREISE